MAERSIGVDSVLELYTTVLGWVQYEHIWNLLVDTGLVFIPFIGLLLKNTLLPIQSQQEGGASVTSLKRFELDVLSALIVILIAGQPLIEIKHEEIKFTNPCVINENNTKLEPKTMGVEDARYKDALFMLSADSAKVPIWWYAVMAVSTGVNYAMKHSMPCSGDIVVSEYLIHNEIVPDTSDNPLRKDIEKFMKECYFPTIDFIFALQRGEIKSRFDRAVVDFDREYKSRFFRNRYWKPQNAPGSTNSGGLSNIGILSTLWVGSEFLLNANFRFTYKFMPINIDIAEGKVKRIPCREYWLSPLPGQTKNIRERLIDVLDTKHLQRLVLHQQGFRQTGIGEAEIESMDAEELGLLHDYAMMRIIRAHFQPNRKNLVTTQRDFDDSQFQSSVTASIGRKIGTFGIIMKFLTIYPLAKVVSEGAPIAQACLLLALYMMLPIGLVFSGFSIQYLVVGAVGLFSLKFLGYVIYLAHWLNNTFLTAIQGQGFSGSMLGSSPINAYAEIVLVNAYFLFPMLYLGVMGWAGYQLSQGVQGAYGALIGEESTAAQGAQTGGQMIQAEAVNLGTSLANKALGSTKGGTFKMAGKGFSMAWDVLKRLSNMAGRMTAFLAGGSRRRGGR